jgi:multidrug efflux pump
MAFIKLTDWGKRSLTADEFIPQANGVLHGVTRCADLRGEPADHPRPEPVRRRRHVPAGALPASRAPSWPRRMGTLLGKAGRAPCCTASVPTRCRRTAAADECRPRAGAVDGAVGHRRLPRHSAAAGTGLHQPLQYGGRVKRVYVQADAPYRMGPDALQHIYTPSTS